MASLRTVSVAEIQVDSVTFPPSAKPPGSTKTLFLGGAGVRGLEIQGKFVAITAIGVYLEEDALPSLAVKWKGKKPEELSESADFFRDLLTGPFEKFTWVRMILPLTGRQYSEKVVEACTTGWKSSGTYADAEATIIEKFLEAFRDETFLPGASVLYTQLPNGSLTIAFTKDESIPKIGKKVIEYKRLSEAILDSVVGEHSISPQAKKSLAARISRLLIDV